MMRTKKSSVGKVTDSTEHMLRKIFKDLANRGMTSAAIGLINDDDRLMKPSVEWDSFRSTRMTPVEWCIERMAFVIAASTYRHDMSIDVYTKLYVALAAKAGGLSDRLEIHIKTSSILNLARTTTIGTMIELATSAELSTGGTVIFDQYVDSVDDGYNESVYKHLEAVLSSDEAAFILARYRNVDRFRTFIEMISLTGVDTI